MTAPTVPAQPNHTIDANLRAGVVSTIPSTSDTQIVGTEPGTDWARTHPGVPSREIPCPPVSPPSRGPVAADWAQKNPQLVRALCLQHTDFTELFGMGSTEYMSQPVDIIGDSNF